MALVGVFGDGALAADRPADDAQCVAMVQHDIHLVNVAELAQVVYGHPVG